MAEPVVLDTSAVLAYVDDEDGAEVIADYLRTGQRRVVALYAASSHSLRSGTSRFRRRTCPAPTISWGLSSRGR